MEKRQLKLGAFMRPVSIHTGAWRYPGAWPDANFNFPHIKKLIQPANSTPSSWPTIWPC
jgi:alkanesulfonate monooxygenase